VTLNKEMQQGITQCNLPPNTSDHTSPNRSHAVWYLIYIAWRDGRLSWLSWLDSASAGNQTRDLSITSMMPNRYTTKTNHISSLATGSMAVDVQHLIHHLLTVASVMLSGLVFADLFHTTLQNCLSILCAGIFSYYSHPTAPKTSGFNFLTSIPTFTS